MSYEQGIPSPDSPTPHMSSHSQTQPGAFLRYPSHLQGIPKPIPHLNLTRSRLTHRFPTLELPVLSTEVKAGEGGESDGEDGGGHVDAECDEVAGWGFVEVGL